MSVDVYVAKIYSNGKVEIETYDFKDVYPVPKFLKWRNVGKFVVYYVDNGKKKAYVFNDGIDFKNKPFHCYIYPDIFVALEKIEELIRR